MASYTLSPAQYRQIKTTVLTTILPDLQGRKVLPKDPEIGPGAQEASRTMLDYGDEDARVIPKAGRYGIITPTEEIQTVYIRKIGQAFVVTDEDLESSRVNGRGLDRRSIQIASRKIQEFEDHFIFNGYDKLQDENGLLGATTQNKASDDKWDTPDGEPYETANDAVTMIEKWGYTARFAIFNNQDFGLLRRTDIMGNVYKDMIVKNLGIPDGNILKSTQIPKGTALVMDSGPTIAELKEVEPIFIKPPLEQANDTQLIRIRERIGMDVYQPNALCTISNIS